MPNIKNVFDWIKIINQTKEHISEFSEEDWKKFEPFMIHRGLSQDPDLVELCDYIQGLGVTDKKQLYQIYSDFIPKNKKWNGWIKSKTKGKNKELIEILNGYFECSTKRTIEYLDILDKKELTKILSSIGIEDKEVKKLIK